MYNTIIGEDNADFLRDVTIVDPNARQSRPSRTQGEEGVIGTTGTGRQYSKTAKVEGAAIAVKNYQEDMKTSIAPNKLHDVGQRTDINLRHLARLRVI